MPLVTLLAVLDVPDHIAKRSNSALLRDVMDMVENWRDADARHVGTVRVPSRFVSVERGVTPAARMQGAMEAKRCAKCKAVLTEIVLPYDPTEVCMDCGDVDN